MNEEGSEPSIKGIVIDENFEKSERETETYEWKEEVIYPQEYNTDSLIVKISDDLFRKKMKSPRVQAIFKTFGHRIKSIFKIRENYYHQNEFLDLMVLDNKYSNKHFYRFSKPLSRSMNETVFENISFLSTCWKGKY